MVPLLPFSFKALQAYKVKILLVVLNLAQKTMKNKKLNLLIEIT